MYNSTNTENYYPYNNMMYQNSDNMQYISSENDDRLIGGFAFPFLLGGVTGAALAPNFYRPNYYRPYYSPYYYRPYPYYYRRF